MKKRSFLILLLAALLLAAGCGSTEAEPDRSVAKQPLFGTFSAKTLDGDTVGEEIFSEHKLTMVNIWATFCSPCINEMPFLGEISREYGASFQVVGVVLDAADQNGNVLSDKKADAEKIVQATDADYVHLLPSPDLNRAYLSGVMSVPETVFLDENGCQVGPRYVGAKSKSEWKAIIDSLLEEAA